jgi:DNA-binding transcriptional regulator YdaS (Cro superfamily)
VGPRVHRRCIVVLALGLAGASAGPAIARAEPEASRSALLEWDAPEGCPSAAEATAHLRERLAPDVPMPEVRAVVRLEGATYAAQIEIRAGDVGTHRELGSPSCETLLDVTTLLAATIAEEASTAVANEPTTSPRVEAELPAPPIVREPAPRVATPGPRAEPITAAPTEERRPPPRAIELHAEARVIAGLGVAPDVDIGGGGALGLTLRHAAFELAGSGGVPREAGVAEGMRVRVAWWSLEARACGRLALGASRRVHVLPCGALLAGDYATAGDGDALRRSDRKHDAWLAAALGPMLTVRLGRWVGLVAGLEGLAFLRRPAAAIDPLGEVLRVRPIGVRALLGVRVRFSVTDRAGRRDVGP